MKHFILFYFWELHFLFKVLLLCLNFELDPVSTIEEVVLLLGDTSFQDFMQHFLSLSVTGFKFQPVLVSFFFFLVTFWVLFL